MLKEQSQGHVILKLNCTENIFYLEQHWLRINSSITKTLLETILSGCSSVPVAEFLKKHMITNYQSSYQNLNFCYSVVDLLIVYL